LAESGGDAHRRQPGAPQRGSDRHAGFQPDPDTSTVAKNRRSRGNRQPSATSPPNTLTLNPGAKQLTRHPPTNDLRGRRHSHPADRKRRHGRHARHRATRPTAEPWSFKPIRTRLAIARGRYCGCRFGEPRTSTGTTPLDRAAQKHLHRHDHRFLRPATLQIGNDCKNRLRWGPTRRNPTNNSAPVIKRRGAR